MKKFILKEINFIKKHDNIFSIILFFLAIFGITTNVLITNSDELWVFQNIYKMYNGFQIYKDANVIVTPLFFIVGEGLFKLLGANFLILRIYNIIIMVAIFFITYLLLKKIKINRKISIIIVLGLIIWDGYTLVLGQANYNTMSLMLYILGVYIYNCKPKYNNIIQGIILFLVFSTKQNIGIFYGIGLFMCEILDEKSIKDKIKSIVKQFFIFFILLMLFLLYLYRNNILYNFIDYTILGIDEFASENKFIDISNVILIIFFILINIIVSNIFINSKKINIKKCEKQQLIILNCFSVPLALVIIPIPNNIHFFIGIYLLLIVFIYIVKMMIENLNLKKHVRITNFILIVVSFLECTISLISFFYYIKFISSENYKFEIDDPFFGVVYDEEFINNVENMVTYIENSSNNIIVLSDKAAFYTIPMKKSNGNMDLPLKGNLGKRGENGLIEDIQKMDNLEILIEKNEENMQWQESKKVREYIIKNMEKIGEIEQFYIYKQKN